MLRLVVVLVLVLAPTVLGWERYDPTPVWNVSGLSGTPTGNGFGFGIASGNVVTAGSKRDLCVIVRGTQGSFSFGNAPRLQCFYHSSTTAPFYPSAPDYEWVSNQCSTVQDRGPANDASRRWYQPISIAMGRYHDSSWDTVGITASAWVIDTWRDDIDNMFGYTDPFGFLFDPNSGSGYSAGDCLGTEDYIKFDDDSYQGFGRYELGDATSVRFGRLDSGAGSGIDSVVWGFVSNARFDFRLGYYDRGQVSVYSGNMNQGASGRQSLNRWYEGVEDVAHSGVVEYWYGYRAVPYPWTSFSSYDDTAVAAPHASFDFGGPGIALFGVGAVLVYHSNGNGLEPNWFLRVRGSQVNEQFGEALEFVGDLNGDGVDDLVIGASLYSDEDTANIGRVVIIWGDSKYDSATQYTYDSTSSGLGTNGQVVYNPSSSGVAYARFGSSVLGVPDLNNDGINELLVGSPGHNGYRGRVQLFQGSLGGVLEDAVWTMDSPAQTTELFGYALALTDANDDGYSDLFVSGYGEGSAAVGSVYLFLANPNTAVQFLWESPYAGTAVRSGQNTTVGLVFGVVGPENLGNLTMTFVFPQALTNFGAEEVGGLSPSSCLEETLVGQTPEAYKITCYFPSGMTVGQEARLNFTFSTELSAAGGAYELDVSIDADIEVQGAHEKVVVIEYVNIVDLAYMGGSQSNDTLYSGTSNLYEFIWINLGPCHARSVEISMQFGPSVGLVYDRITDFAGFQCDDLTPQDVLICRAQDFILVGAQFRMKVLAYIDPSYPGSSVSAGAVASTASNDTYPLNNTGMHYTAVEQFCDLQVQSMTYAPSGVLDAGKMIEFTVGILNPGPSSCLNSVLSFKIPAGSKKESMKWTGGTDILSKCVTTPINSSFELFVCSGETISPTVSVGHELIFQTATPGTFSAPDAEYFLNMNTTTPEATSLNQEANATVPITIDSDLSVYFSVSCTPQCMPGANISYAVRTKNEGPSSVRRIWTEFEYPQNFTLYSYPANYTGFYCLWNESFFRVQCYFSLFLDQSVSLQTMVFLFGVPENFNVSFAPLSHAKVTATDLSDSNLDNNDWYNNNMLSARAADLYVEKVRFFFPLSSDVADNGTLASVTGPFDTEKTFFHNENAFEIVLLVANAGPSYARDAHIYLTVPHYFTLYELGVDVDVLQLPVDQVPPAVGFVAKGMPAELGFNRTWVDRTGQLNRTDVTILRLNMTYMSVATYSPKVAKFYVYQNLSESVLAPNLKFWSTVWTDEVVEVSLENNYVLSKNTALIKMTPYVPPVVPPAEPEVEETGPGAVEAAGAAIGVVMLALIIASCVFLIVVLCVACFITNMIAYTLFSSYRKRRRAILKREALKRRRLGKFNEDVDGSLDDEDFDDDDDETEESEESESVDDSLEFDDE